MIKIGILGCGLSGMLSALSLAKKGISSTIIENKSVERVEFYNDIRTTALTPYSQNFLENLLLWRDLVEYTAAMQDVYVVDNKASEILHLTDKEHKVLPEKSYSQSLLFPMMSFPPPRESRNLNMDPHFHGDDKKSIFNDTALGYIIKNSDFKRILLINVQKNPLIQLIDNCEYEKIESYKDHSVVILQDGEKIKYDLLIICDGVNSKVRSYFFANEIEKPYQTALTFNIRHEKAHENCAMEHFLPLGPFALLPFRDQYCSSIIWSTSSEQSSLLNSLPKEEFRYLVQRNCGRSFGMVTIDSVVSIFPLRARLANRYYHNRLVLIADSAHIVHPLAGQGLNQGIKDIEILTNLISEGGVLAQYQQLRQEDNWMMYKITDEINNIFSNYSQNFLYLRQIGFKIINKLPPIKDFIINYAIGKR